MLRHVHVSIASSFLWKAEVVSSEFLPFVFVAIQFQQRFDLAYLSFMWVERTETNQRAVECLVKQQYKISK